MDASAGDGAGLAEESARQRPGQPDQRGRLRLGDLSEEGLLAVILPIMAADPADPRVLLGPGDDAAVIAAGDGRFVATTDAMVRGLDWLDEWSSGADVGRKCVAQNLADVAAMGAIPAGLLISLQADRRTAVDWAADLARGIASAAAAAGCPVLGGTWAAHPMAWCCSR